MTRTFKLNKNGKIELTKEELKKLLDEVYEEGRGNVYVYTTPYTYSSPWYINTAATADSITISNQTSTASNKSI